MTKQGGQLEVFTDGRCPLCRQTRRWVEPRDAAGRISWFDYNEPEALRRAAPHTPEELAREMHARLNSGVWRRGYDAVIEVLAVLPRWRRLVPALRFAPVRIVGKIVYRFVARRRYRLFGLPAPCDAHGSCAVGERG